jgi:hypothetical protein
MENVKKMIHVRFTPAGEVAEIGERPQPLSPQGWFNELSDKAGAHYQALAGGRGVFRLSAEELETVKNAVAI